MVEPSTLTPPAETKALSIALKEWAVVCLALATGRQVIILRRGGTEDGGDAFENPPREFLLYPTWFHESEKDKGKPEDRVSPDARQLLQEADALEPDEGEVTFRHFAEVVESFKVTSKTQLDALRGKHVLADSVVEERLTRDGKGALRALILKVYSLGRPITITAKESYGGCKSWVTLDQAIPVTREWPAVRDDERNDDRVFARMSGAARAVFREKMTRIERLEIEGFRGIAKGLIEGFADVNIFVGRNNCGKSTALEAICGWLDDVASQYQRTLTDPMGRTFPVRWQAARSETGSLDPLYLFFRARKGKTALAEVRGAMCQGETGFPTTKLLTAVWNLSQDAVLLPHRQSNSPETDSMMRQLLNIPSFSFFERAAVFLPEDHKDSHIERTLWENLLDARIDRFLVGALNEIFGTAIKQLHLSQTAFKVLFDQYGHPVDLLGDGARAALRCLMLLTVLENTFFMIEEPESCQHPGSLRRFARGVCTLARERRVQLFLTTHSMECVRAFCDAAEEAASECAVFHLRLSEGDLQARRFVPDEARALLHLGVDLRHFDLYA
ncbi:MAG: DUF1802 family protein [Planctomycetes bacterium]|nr:DUF1802 family protein [Planctomycetota bacterium]